MRLLHEWERYKVPTYGGLFCKCIALLLFLAVVYLVPYQLHRSLILIIIFDSLMPDYRHLHNISYAGEIIEPGPKEVG